jgi:seryl-tRNA synthetase
LGEALGILDFERGVKLSGSRFYVLKGLGARLQRALDRLDAGRAHQRSRLQRGLPPLHRARPDPVRHRQPAQVHRHLYRDIEDDLWLIPTAEVPVTNLYRDEILPPGSLPIYHVAYTPCFRREKMSAGKDVRGIKRGHQFDKVEMVKFVEPEQGRPSWPAWWTTPRKSPAGWASPIASCRCVPATWPSRPRPSTISSCGRRAAASGWRSAPARSSPTSRPAAPTFATEPEEGAKPRFVYTLNGSGLALPRVMIAVLENYQQADGSVRVPDVLVPYMGGVEVIR